MQPRYIAQLRTGLQIIEDDILDTCETFPLVMAAFDRGELASFTVEGEGFSAALDYDHMIFRVGDAFAPLSPDARPIFYKRMSMDSHGGERRCEFVALGWQTTDRSVEPWKNQRFGVRLDFFNKRFEVTEEV